MAADGSTARVTLAQVAAAAGVSVPTVSKVLNGRGDVAPATRARVEEVLDVHEYVPRRRRRPAPPRRLDLVLDALHSWYGMEIIHGVVTAGEESGIDVTVGTTPVDVAGQDWVRTVLDRGALGVIVVTSSLSGEQLEAFRAAGLPLVVIDPVGVADGVPSVGATNWAGGLSATEHLIALGHHRIAVLGGRQAALCARARVHGYRAALEAAGIPPDDRLVRYGDFEFELAYRSTGELLDLDDPPTGIFATSDTQAFGVVEAARVRGLRVPQDLSVVGFDDLSISRWAAPPLTTVRQPMAAMGQVACQTLVRLAAGEPLASTRVELATELIVRESTAPPRTSTRGGSGGRVTADR
ncbi:MAG TPA: LacI family DNA-binding transcriptional regulator [Euzebyales bacterium]|nr:LacI family DNA-binding transcriptional regulator [Euzebyales bacterium]